MDNLKKLLSTMVLFLMVSAPLHAAPGSTLWSVDIGGNIGSSAAYDHTNGQLYVGSADKRLYALDNVGNVLWTFATQVYIAAAPLVSADGAVVYITSYDHHVYAIDTQSGIELWRFNTGDIVYASVAIDQNNHLYIGSRNGIFYALDSATGAEQWQLSLGSVIGSSAAIEHNGYVYVGAADGYLYAIDPLVLQVNPSAGWVWRAFTGGGLSSPVIDFDGHVYVGSHDYSIYSFDRDTGAQRWSTTLGGRITSSPVIDSQGNLYVSTFDNGALNALAPSGSLIWSLPLSNNAEPLYSSPALANDGTVFVGAFDGVIRAINPSAYSSSNTPNDPQSLVVWSTQLGSPAVSSPLIDNMGTVYIIAQNNSFYAIESDITGAANSAWPLLGKSANRNALQVNTDADGDGLSDNRDPFPSDPDNGLNHSAWAACSGEWHFCSPPAPAFVRYGAAGQYAYAYVTDTIHCMNPVFGDPAPGVLKSCEYLLSDQDDFDGDGVVDRIDAFPMDANETLDSDQDGTGNNADPFPYEPDNNVAGGWVSCGNEWTTCTVPVPAEVRYGANGQYATQQVQDSIACANSTFGGDPISGVFKACSYSLSSTADFDGDGVVDSIDAFPADISESTDSDYDGIGDNDDLFPQDATNNPTANWVHCANDNAVCQLPSSSIVRYGAGSQYLFKVVTDSITCSASVFGDPAPNLAKTCSYMLQDTDGDGLLDNNDPFPADPENGIDDAGWTACAREWHFCSPPVPAYVRYGANGQYVYQHTDDTIHCMNPVFGDPAPGVVKYCDYLLSDTDDFDGDGVVDRWDAFPADNTETLDSDKDGIGDHSDVFPNDPNQ